MNKLVSTIGAAIALTSAILTSDKVWAATFVVNSTADTGGSCGTTCTLRQAITAANLTPASDTINFSFRSMISPDDPAANEVLIRPATRLPTITQPLIVNGYSVQSAQVNTHAGISNARIRIRIDGFNSVSNDIGLSVCASNVTIKGLSITGWRGAGIHFGNNQTLGNLCASASTGGAVHGNFIGLTTTGTNANGNALGIGVQNALVNIGTTAAADRNIISATAGSGIEIGGATAAGSTLRNNLIGTGRNGNEDLGNGFGLSLSTSNVGVGASAGENLFRFNTKAIRVLTGGAALDNDLQRNRFFNNDQMAIDLSDNGVNAVDRADPDDTDSGPNGLQNVPIISTVDRISGGVHVAGTLDVPVTINPLIYTMGVYASALCHASGSGEGEIFLGTKDVALRGNTLQTFSFDLLTASTIPTGGFLTLTVDGPDGTSEFSSCTAIDDLLFEVNSADDVVDAAGCTAAHCNLRDAISAANTHFGPDLITFEISTPASGEILIQPTSPLPIITDTTTIDGYSQSGAVANTDPLISNAAIRIRVDGSNVTSGDDLFSVCANGSIIRGLSITGMTSGLGRAISVCNSVSNAVAIVGNFIGLASDGLTNAANDLGVMLIGPATVGGSNPEDRNVISKNTHGVALQGGGLLLGNLIGTDKTGTLNKGNVLAGVKAVLAVDTTIGSANAPNLIRFNGTGIGVANNLNNHNLVWTHNRIFGNTSIGIDLGDNGPSFNDTNDADSGPNQMQNFPELDRAERTGNGLRVSGTLDVPVNANNRPYVIGVYASTACDSSGFGQGERLLGAFERNFTQTAAEAFSFELITDDPLTAGTQITTTAAGPDGSSEFSRCILVTDPPMTLEVTVAADTDDGICDIHCTLREAINRANTQIGENQILFAINSAGAGPHEILLTSPLPVITDAVVIDGYLNQTGASPNAADVGSDAVIKINLNAGAEPNILRICSAGRVEVRGLAFGSASSAAIATKSNDTSCSVSGSVVIRGNFFGLNPDGTANANQTALLITDTGASIGGGALADRNLFAHSTGVAVKLAGSGGNGSTVANNLFGIGVDGVGNAGNAATALELIDISSVTVAAATGEANRFRFNQRGIVIKGNTSRGNRVFTNEFSDHVGMAIDLSANGTDTDGITANDDGDTDNGPNELHNFPELISFSSTATTITINGLLRVGNPGVEARVITFYESTSCDNASNREGEIILESQLANLGVLQQNFSITLNITPPAASHFITATATNFQGQTSEFSNCLSLSTTIINDALFANEFE